jgi:hypothetical protein
MAMKMWIVGSRIVTLQYTSLQTVTTHAEYFIKHNGMETYVEVEVWLHALTSPRHEAEVSGQSH